MIELKSYFPGGFTVLMAVYERDNSNLFRSAVHSVFANTLLPNAFVLVVDGPLSAALNAAVTRLEAMYDLVVVRLKENSGLAHALNAGLQYVKTDWVVRADADDFNLPFRFERLSALASQRPELHLIGSAIREVDIFQNPIATRSVPIERDAIIRFAAFRNPFNHMSVAFRRSAVLASGGYPNIHLKEDYALWCLMLAAGCQAANLSEPLVNATTGEDMYRRRGGIRYALAEIKLQRLLVSSGFKSNTRAIIDGLLRSGGFVIPSAVRGFLYRNVLREKA